MLLSHKSVIKVNKDYSNIIGHMCYAAYKLWNVCNYERLHHEELSLPVSYPDWYYQKKAHKDDLWYKSLPSQTAQDVCKLLDKAWKSFYALQKSGSMENPRPPKFKRGNIAITYMQNGIRHVPGSSTVCLSLPKKLKEYMSSVYGICDKFLVFENQLFKNTDVIKQIRIYPPEKGECRVIVIYEVPDTELLPDNGRYLSIDLGLHNLMACYDSVSGNTFIAGRKYLSITRYYDKEIGRVQSQWYSLQSKKRIKHPKTSVHIRKLYRDKNNAVNDYLHKVTRYIVRYCVEHEIHTVIIGDITNIRKENSLGHVRNQKLHALPYKKIYIMLGYKLALEGIRFIMQKEPYSSQTSPLMDSVCKENATSAKRVCRGLYLDGGYAWNADCVGAYNILRLYLQEEHIHCSLDPYGIKTPYIVKVAA